MKGKRKPERQEKRGVADTQASDILTITMVSFFTLPGLLSMKPPVRQTDPVGTLHQLWASKLMLRSWLRPHLPKAMATVASGPPRSLQDEGVNLTVGGLGWEAS